jgi:hypothetical protein
LLMQKDRISKHKDGKAELKKIARYIYDRFKELQSMAEDPCRDCAKFTLPTASEIIPWVRDVQRPRSLLPGRSS